LHNDNVRIIIIIINFYRAMHLVQSAVSRLHVVRLSIRLSVTLVDQDHIGWKSWNCTDCN